MALTAAPEGPGRPLSPGKPRGPCVKEEAEQAHQSQCNLQQDCKLMSYVSLYFSVESLFGNEL